MLGIDDQLEELYIKAQADGEAAIKDRWVSGNYNCCSTNAPLIEKYKIVNTDKKQSFYIWQTLVVTIDTEDHTSVINKDYKASNYDKKVIDWLIQKSR